MNLEDKIREALPRLKSIEKGQRFLSDYYGVIVATKITEWSKDVYSIYGFDEIEGLPRDCYYPRDLKLIGYPVKLNDVIEYLLYTRLYSPEDKQIIRVLNIWNFSSVFLADQNEGLKEFLNSL